MSDHEQEDGHVRSASLDVARKATPTTPRADDQSYSVTEALLRLLVGLLLESRDEFRHQYERWEANGNSVLPAAMSESVRYAPLSEAIRHAFVGMLFESEAYAHQRLSSMMERFLRLSETAEYAYTTRFAPAVRQTPLDPIVGFLDEALFVAMGTVDRWSARGRFEERRGRALAQQTAASIADELLDYLARNPEVRALVEQQGSSMAEEAMDSVRDRTASADARIERIAHSLFRRPARDATAESAPDAGASTRAKGGG